MPNQQMMQAHHNNTTLVHCPSPPGAPQAPALWLLNRLLARLPMGAWQAGGGGRSGGPQLLRSGALAATGFTAQRHPSAAAVR
jgi:hypothetical protein